MEPVEGENSGVSPDLSWANLIGLELNSVSLEGANVKLGFLKDSQLRMRTL